MESIIDIKDLNGRDVAVGEKVRIDGEVYECVENKGCRECAFVLTRCPFTACSSGIRKDGKNVTFVKQEQMETNENKELNLAEILNGYPKGMMLYSPIFGYVWIVKLNNPIIQVKTIKGETVNFYSNGKYDYNGEVMLFPSKDQRDWSKFRLPVEPPFDIKRVKKGEHYYIISNIYEAVEDIETEAYWDNNRYKRGNYFNTPEQAEYAAEKVKELLLSLRKEDK